MNCRFYIVVLSNNWVHFMFDPASDILIQDCFCSTPMMGNRLFDLTDYIQNPGVNRLFRICSQLILMMSGRLIYKIPGHYY